MPVEPKPGKYRRAVIFQDLSGGFSVVNHQQNSDEPLDDEGVRVGVNLKSRVAGWQHFQPNHRLAAVYAVVLNHLGLVEWRQFFAQLDEVGKTLLPVTEKLEVLDQIIDGCVQKVRHSSVEFVHCLEPAPHQRVEFLAHGVVPDALNDLAGEPVQKHSPCGGWV